MNKEESVLKLFFDEPTKYWHFEDILKVAKISRPQAAMWLNKFIQKKVISRVKFKKKMPHYIANYNDVGYQMRKRIFALNYMEKNGFLSHLASLPKARTIIIFGSMTRWDWYKNSDIDVFIYGDSEGLMREEYWTKLGREIETFTCKDKSELSKFPLALLKNILEGYLVKGTFDFIKVDYA